MYAQGGIETEITAATKEAAGITIAETDLDPDLVTATVAVRLMTRFEISLNGIVVAYLI